MDAEQPDILQSLVSGGFISDSQAYEARLRAEQESVTPLRYLITHTFIDEATLGAAIASHYGTTFTNLSTYTPSPDMLTMIPEEIAKKYHVVWVGKDDEGTFIFATDRIGSTSLASELKALFPNTLVHSTYAFTEQIERFLTHY